jgi:hypothetical protein
MFNIKFGAGAVGDGAASRYDSGSTKIMRLLADPAPTLQHWKLIVSYTKDSGQSRVSIVGGRVAGY